jgi:hypothetical protein
MTVQGFKKVKKKFVSYPKGEVRVISLTRINHLIFQWSFAPQSAGDGSLGS